MKITEKKFIWVLLNNMKHHRFYKERIASFLTGFEPTNPSSISQKWIENNFYSLDEDRLISFRNKFRESARFSHDQHIRNKNEINKYNIKKLTHNDKMTVSWILSLLKAMKTIDHNL